MLTIGVSSLTKLVKFPTCQIICKINNSRRFSSVPQQRLFEVKFSLQDESCPVSQHQLFQFSRSGGIFSILLLYWQDIHHWMSQTKSFSRDLIFPIFFQTIHPFTALIQLKIFLNWVQFLSISVSSIVLFLFLFIWVSLIVLILP